MFLIVAVCLVAMPVAEIMLYAGVVKCTFVFGMPQDTRSHYANDKVGDLCTSGNRAPQLSLATARVIGALT